jgi:hypothetical protein
MTYLTCPLSHVSWIKCRLMTIDQSQAIWSPPRNPSSDAVFQPSNRPFNALFPVPFSNFGTVPFQVFLPKFLARTPGKLRSRTGPGPKNLPTRFADRLPKRRELGNPVGVGDDISHQANPISATTSSDVSLPGADLRKVWNGFMPQSRKALFGQNPSQAGG